MQGSLRTLLSEETEQYFWYNRGKQLALDIAQGLDFLHSRDLVRSGSCPCTSLTPYMLVAAEKRRSKNSKFAGFFCFFDHLPSSIGLLGRNY